MGAAYYPLALAMARQKAVGALRLRVIFDKREAKWCHLRQKNRILGNPYQLPFLGKARRLSGALSPARELPPAPRNTAKVSQSRENTYNAGRNPKKLD